MKIAAIVVSVLVILGGIWWYVTDLVADGTWDLPASTWFFMVGAIIFAFAVAGALMALLFYSNRSGHDDDVSGA